MNRAAERAHGVLARVCIVDVVAPFVEWDRGRSRPDAGDYWSCCPFHQERTASFHVRAHEQRYRCFACGASGDVIDFLRAVPSPCEPSIQTDALDTLASEN